MPFVGLGVGVGRQRFRGGFVGLLDTYSGAAAAYSLRQLSSTYSGDAIRVRRASDNTEQDIGFVNNELDTSTLATFCSGTDGFVTTWYDQSGNSNDVTQSTAANQPKIYDSVNGVIEENSKPAIDFDGTNDTIESSVFTTISQPFTTFSISKENVSARAIFGGADNVINKRFAMYNVGGVYTLFNGSNGTSTIPFTLNQKQLTTISNSPNTAIYVNGISGGSSLNSGSSGLESIRLSGYYRIFDLLNGNIQEFILYPNDKSINRIDIENNQINYYNI